MKSSEAASDLDTAESQNLLPASNPLYTILAVYIPVSVLAGILPSLNFLTSMYVGPAPVTFWFFASLLSGIIASIYWAIVKRSLADHTAASIRGSLLVAVMVYFTGSLLRSGLPVTARFFPSFQNFVSGVFAFGTWVFVLKIKRILEGQELIDSHTRSYDGEMLRQKMLEDSGMMSEADSGMKKLLSYYRVVFLLPFLLYVPCGALGMPLSASLAVFFTFLFLAGVFIVAYLGFLRREYAFASEGLISPSRPGTLFAGMLIILAAAAVALLMSSGKSLLSFSIIVYLFQLLLALLKGIFSGKETEIPPPPEAVIMQNDIPFGMPKEMLEAMAEPTPTRFWDYLTYVVLGLVILVFILFMIKPLLSRSGLFSGKGTWLKRMAVFFTSWFKALASGLKWFFSSLRGGAGGRRLTDKALLRGIRDSILEGYSAEKRRDMRRSVNLFARLIYWGIEVMRVGWRPSLAPTEYCGLLAAAVSVSGAVAAVSGEAVDNGGLIHGIVRSGALFDKALYSAEPLTRPEGDEFKALVEMVTAKS